MLRCDLGNRIQISWCQIRVRLNLERIAENNSVGKLLVLLANGPDPYIGRLPLGEFGRERRHRLIKTAQFRRLCDIVHYSTLGPKLQ